MPADTTNVKVLPFSRPTGFTMSDYFDLRRRWVLWMSARGMSPSTIRNYSEVVRNFIDAIEKQPDRITDQDVALYLDSMGKQGPARNRIIQGLRSFFGWMSDHGETERNPAADFKPRKVRYNTPRCLTREQCEQVFGAAEARSHKQRIVLELMYRTGMRVGSLVHLRPSDIDFDAGLVRIATAKNDDPYEVPISSTLRPMLAQLVEMYDSTRGPFLVGVKDRSVWLWCKNAGEDVGIPHVHPHLLRHSFCTHLLKSGVDVDVVRQLMNHKSLAVTQSYVTSTAPERVAGVEAI